MNHSQTTPLPDDLNQDQNSQTVRPANDIVRLLTRLERGFRMDSVHLRELEKSLAMTLDDSRNIGMDHVSQDDWSPSWHQQWDNIEKIFQQIRMLVSDMDGSIESGDSDYLSRALGAWDNIQTENAKMAAALSALREQASPVNTLVKKDWEVLMRAVDSHLDAIQACAEALRLKLEMLKEHSKEEVDRLVQDILSKLPSPSLTDPNESERESYEQLCRKASAELEQERHRYLGVLDVIKGLFLWVETPEERVNKNLSREAELAN